MKIAFCLFKYFPFGGLEGDLIQLARKCLARGHSIDVLTMSWAGPLEPGINVIEIPSRGLSNHKRAQHFSKSIAVMKKDYDLCVGFNRIPNVDVYYAADVCFAQRAQEKHPFTSKFMPRYRTYCQLERALFSKSFATEILYLAEQQKKDYQFHYQTPESHFHYIPPGITKRAVTFSDWQLNYLKQRDKLNIDATQKIILMVAAFPEQKGIHRAFIALSQLPPSLRQNTKFWIIGGGKTAKLQKQIVNLGIQDNVEFLGFQNNVFDYMLAADVFIHPALVENTGKVLLEALSAGLPVITTANCGFAEHIEAAKAGIVLTTPFIQFDLNNALQELLLKESVMLRQGALHYAGQQDLYSAFDTAVKIIEEIALKKERKAI